MKVLVTGAAGFIGAHLVKRLIKQGHQVVGIDNLNDYYDVNLKLARLDWIGSSSAFEFIRMDIEDAASMNAIFAEHQFNQVVHLAAQAGVRYSLENPSSYMKSNMMGFYSILEACRQYNITHLVYASSSSVYGLNKKVPFSVDDNVDHPVSLYAATKKSNELMAHSYSHLYNIPTTGLRFFTVYGPWGRPDMALFKFTKAILAGESIDIYNHGNLSRDFTYIDDIVDGLMAVMASPPNLNVAEDDIGNIGSAPYRIHNIGAGKPVKLLDFVEQLETALGKKAIRNSLPMQKGDLLTTWADTSQFSECYGHSSETSLEGGVEQFVSWYRDYY
ncbi:NAD-dependent epimerase [Shewanella maritima]|uniref:NAD-dependent epimerase n=1 Tax=Shewanella maritima TaxID=2520507 RepID=UPI0037359B3E